MPIPVPVRLFHITAIANLPAICAVGALLAKNRGATAGIAYQNIAHAGAQGARACPNITKIRRTVSSSPRRSSTEFRQCVSGVP